MSFITFVSEHIAAQYAAFQAASPIVKGGIVYGGVAAVISPLSYKEGQMMAEGRGKLASAAIITVAVVAGPVLTPARIGYRYIKAVKAAKEQITQIIATPAVVEAPVETPAVNTELITALNNLSNTNAEVIAAFKAAASAPARTRTTAKPAVKKATPVKKAVKKAKALLVIKKAVHSNDKFAVAKKS